MQIHIFLQTLFSFWISHEEKHIKLIFAIPKLIIFSHGNDKEMMAMARFLSGIWPWQNNLRSLEFSNEGKTS